MIPLKDFNTDLLSHYDRQVYDEVLRIKRDCHNWLMVHDLAGRVRSSELKTMLLHTSNVMKSTLDYYDNEGIGE